MAPFSDGLVAGQYDGAQDVTGVSITPLAGPTIVNGDFETGASQFVTSPGYASISGQGGSTNHNPQQVAGFVATAGRNFGINPGNGAGNPFSESTDDATNQLFIQSSGTSVTQNVYGFTPGVAYKLDFEYDSRNPANTSGSSDPGIDVSIAGVSYVVSDVVYSGTYYSAKLDFVASSSSQTLSIEKTNGGIPGDSTALFDNFAISAVVPEPASISLIAVEPVGNESLCEHYLSANSIHFRTKCATFAMVC